MAKLDSISYNGTKYELVPEIAPLFDPVTPYSVGDCVIHYAVLYKFTANHAAGAWTGTDAEVVTVGGELKIKPTFPPQYENIEFTESVGIVNRTNLVPFSSGDSYQGRYTSVPVNPGDVYLITCYSVNNTYPGCFGVVTGGTSAYIPLLLSGSAVAYTDTEITIPDTVTTIYVNANYPNVIKIKKKGYMTQTEFDNRIEKIQSIQSPEMYAKVDGNNNLLFKKKSIVNSKDLCIQMGHSSIGNNLFNFLDMYYKSNLSTLDSDFTPEAGQTSLSLGQTDWLSPYQMKAVSNGDGDHPTSVYFTGGNHRSSNGSSGGGKTATENSLAILFDGVVPDTNKIYACKNIDIYVVNSINGYNTSKDDGTGRNILQEKVHFHITAEKVDVERVLIPLENIVIERNYGLQIYYPSSTVRFIGGESRIPFTVSDNLTSGNKSARDVIASGAFKIESGICDYDIGSFEFDGGAFSYFTSSNKVYSNVIYNNTVQFDASAEYQYKGYYKFN